MSRLGVYDNWGRLVAAVIDREKLRELAFCDSFSSTSSSVAASLSRLNSVSSTFEFGAFGNELDQVTASSSTRRGGGVAAFLFAAPLAYYRRRKLQEHDRKLREYDLFVSNFFFDVPAHQLDQLERFSLGELQLATDDFSSKNILGRGGFGKVYKGRLADGSLVAVKRPKEERTDGHDLQFRAEIKVKLNMAEHPNIRQLRGFCLTSTERLLVFPYMANGSVTSCLRERPESQPPLDWPTRERIALSSAKGLAYLHDQCHKKIIHHDIKLANILLNEDFEAVIGDFGLVKFMDHRDAYLSTDVEAVTGDVELARLMDQEDIHVTTTVRGTIGHIAPEYLSTGKVSEKNDVFGYGVMLLELTSGQRAFDLARHANGEDVMLLDWVKGLLKDKKLEAILVDTDLGGNYIDGEVEKMIQLALLCCQDSPKKRPKMSNVVQMLQGDDGLAERWHKYCQEDEILPQESSYADYDPKYVGECCERREVYDNWAKLYEAVRKQEDLRRLALCASISSSSSADSSSRFSFESSDVVVVDGLLEDSSFPVGLSDISCLIGEILPTPSLKTYSFADLKNATLGFKSDLVLGKGDYMTVYMGWVDEVTHMPSQSGTGMMVAVKKRNTGDCQYSDEGHPFDEFLQSEVNVFGKMLHPNLVKLLGYCYCSEGKERLFVCEFMKKGNLENHLFGRNSYSEPLGIYLESERLSWDIRLEIAIGAARGLAFLHTPIKQVIYRDFKASNILLDGSYNAKLTNSCLAILGPAEGESHVETTVMGTPGYACPEYVATGRLCVKSDVYSFGVVLLEILTGLRVIDNSRPKGQTSLVDWMRPLLGRKKKLKSVMDAHIEGQYSSKAALHAAELVLECLKAEQSSRPSMDQVVETLQQISDMEKHKGPKTSWFMH